jgi:pimeloyl-ACP methyl ester carboxylesterase
MKYKVKIFIITLSLLLSVFILFVVNLYYFNSREFEIVTIYSDNYELSGYLSIGNEENGPWIIFCHGNRKEGNAHPLYQKIISNINNKVSVLAIDFRGFGLSVSDNWLDDELVWNRKRDLEIAVDYIKSHFNVKNEQIILMGHSLGASQIIIAAHNVQYRLLVPIGLGDYDNVLDDENTLHDYRLKFERNTGVMMTEEIMKREGVYFRPRNLFYPCPQTPIALVFGSIEKNHVHSIYNNKHKISDGCDGMISWHTVPFSDHMFWMESRSSFRNKSKKIFSIVYLNYILNNIVLNLK